MELNRDQIIKALECWTKNFDGKVTYFVTLGQALALIKELTEENERLRAEKETLEIYNKDYKFKNKELSAWNRRWAKECQELQEECDKIKADTIRNIKIQVHNKAIYPSTKGDVAYISLKAFDALADGLISDKN